MGVEVGVEVEVPHLVGVERHLVVEEVVVVVQVERRLERHLIKVKKGPLLAKLKKGLRLGHLLLHLLLRLLLHLPLPLGQPKLRPSQQKKEAPKAAVLAVIVKTTIIMKSL